MTTSVRQGLNWLIKFSSNTRTQGVWNETPAKLHKGNKNMVCSVVFYQWKFNNSKKHPIHLALETYKKNINTQLEVDMEGVREQNKKSSGLGMKPRLKINNYITKECNKLQFTLWFKGGFP